MSLRYNVLIADDQELIYETYKQVVENFLIGNGYIPVCNRIEQVSELSKYDLNEIDLFLVDLKFGQREQGQEFIKTIRQNLLTDILFYSSDAIKIGEYKQSGEFEFVSFVVREEHNPLSVNNYIIKLLKRVIQRSNTSISTRGIVLSCIAEIDSIIKKRIKILHGRVGRAEDKNKIRKETIRIYRESLKGRINKMRDFFGVDFTSSIMDMTALEKSIIEFDFNELIENIDITDSDKNFRLLMSLYEQLNSKDNFYNSANLFTALLKDRNVLAHAMEENDQGKIKFKYFKSNDYLILTEDKCLQLRKDICKYASLFESIT